MVVEALASKCRVSFNEKSKAYLLGTGHIDRETLLIAMSRTYMNESGKAVNMLLQRTDIVPSHLLVVHDDIDLALGRIQIRKGGGHGGHKGILSVLSVLQTDQFYRLRVGVGRPSPGLDAAQYVLHPFSNEERSLLDDTIQRAVEAITCLVLEGPQRAMDRYNRRVIEAG